MSEPLIDRIEKVVRESNNAYADVIRAVALWINESPIDLYAEDRATVVNSLLDQANTGAVNISQLSCDAMESYYRSCLGKRPTFLEDKLAIGSVVRAIADRLGEETSRIDISVLHDLADHMGAK